MNGERLKNKSDRQTSKQIMKDTKESNRDRGDQGRGCFESEKWLFPHAQSVCCKNYSSLHMNQGKEKDDPIKYQCTIGTRGGLFPISSVSSFSVV